MKQGLETLFKLQQTDDKIRELENKLREIPVAIKKLESERDGKVTIIENTRTKLTENVKAREKLEKEVLQIKEKIKKYRDQMSKATTNKEYQGFNSEIKFEEENIASVEEKIIEKMVESDEIMNEIRDSESEFEKIAGEYNNTISNLNKDLETVKSLIAENIKMRQVTRKQITDRFLAIYDNISNKKNGKAVSFVESNFCGSCNVKIRPQRLNELISSDEMFFCENCGRILYSKLAANKEEN